MTKDESVDAGRPSRQKQVGDALRTGTRARLLQAAEREFAARGYTGTTVTRLAAAAGVSVQTLYLAWGNKRGLLRGYLENALAGRATTPEDAAAGLAGLPPKERLAGLARLVATIAERAALGWTLYRDAAVVDPEIAADWDELQLLRHRTFTRIVGDIPTTALRDGLSRAAAIDTAWTIASPETFDLLTRRLDYSVDQFRDWLEHTLIAALLEPTAQPSRPSG